MSKTWRERLTGAATRPLRQMFDVRSVPASDDGGGTEIGIGQTWVGGRLEVDPLAPAWWIVGDHADALETTEQDALRALLTSAPVALAVASEASSPTGDALEACPIPRGLFAAGHRGWIQQLAAQWKRAEATGLTDALAEGFDRVAAELYALDLNRLMTLETDRRRLMDREE